ncbi:MAG: hypothetical protein LBH05_05445 [Deferribacteraceae bacterium]|nr:hypothetical protein [Deferribacteraceae bacterium]
MRIILIALLFLFGCSKYHAAQSDTMNIENVAVVKIKGDDTSSSFTTLLISVLRSAGYKVYDRAGLELLFSEHKFQMDIASPDTLLEAGKLVGIEAGLVGSYKMNRRTDELDGCKYNIHNLTVDLTMTDYTTGAIVYANVHDEEVTQRICPGKSAQLVVTSVPKYRLSAKFSSDPATLLNRRVSERIKIDLQKTLK